MNSRIRQKEMCLADWIGHHHILQQVSPACHSRVKSAEIGTIILAAAALRTRRRGSYFPGKNQSAMAAFFLLLHKEGICQVTSVLRAAAGRIIAAPAAEQISARECLLPPHTAHCTHCTQ